MSLRGLASLFSLFCAVSAMVPGPQEPPIPSCVFECVSASTSCADGLACAATISDDPDCDEFASDEMATYLDYYDCDQDLSYCSGCNSCMFCYDFLGAPFDCGEFGEVCTACEACFASELGTGAVWLNMPPADDDTEIVIIGDSNMDYWDGVDALGLDVDVAPCGDSCSYDVLPNSLNVGITGSTACQLNAFMPRFNDFYGGMSWYMLHTGSNDFGVAGSTDASAVANCVISIIDTMLENDGARVVYFSTPRDPVSVQDESLLQLYEQLESEVIAYIMSLAVAGSPPRAVVVDVAGSLATLDNPNDLSLYAQDMLHWNELGYSLWTEWGLYAMQAADSSSNTCVVFAGDTCETSV